MPKPHLLPEYAALEREIIETFLAGHHEWRPDLPYPESHSDMSGGARALMRMFEIKRRPVALDRGEIVHPKSRCGGPCCATEATDVCEMCEAKACPNPDHPGYAR